MGGILVRDPMIRHSNRFLSVVATLALSACGGDTTEPADPVGGRYVLRAVDGAQLPVPGTYPWWAVGGTLDVSAPDSMRVTLRNAAPGANAFEQVNTFAYRRSGDSLILPGVLAGGRIEKQGIYLRLPYSFRYGDPVSWYHLTFQRESETNARLPRRYRVRATSIGFTNCSGRTCTNSLQYEVRDDQDSAVSGAEIWFYIGYGSSYDAFTPYARQGSAKADGGGRASFTFNISADSSRSISLVACSGTSELDPETARGKGCSDSRIQR